MPLQIRPLDGPFGAQATGVDLREPLAAADRDALNRALVDNVVLVIRDQDFTPQQYMDAARNFGTPMEQHYSQFNMRGLPQLSVLSSRDSERDADGKVHLRGTECWHTDHTNRERPPKITMLYAVQMPSKGGDTSFADMRAAYRDLPEDLRRRVAGMQTVNRLDRHGNASAEDRARYDRGHVHPMVRTHPESGVKALYFHPTKTERIVGMEPGESLAFIDDLLARIIRPEIVYRHRWRVGDMLLCDNRQALHQAHADYDPDEGRVVYRIILEGDRPV